MNRLHDKTAIITGGSSGIGLATAREFIAQGARVIIMGRRQSALDAAVGSLGENATGVRGDIADFADLDRLADEARLRFGGIDIVIANAGANEPAPFDAVSPDSFDRVFQTNVKGVFFTVQKLLPVLNDGASVVLTGSVASRRVFEGYAVYAGTKAAIRAFARNWAMELKTRGIRVNVLSPGPVKTAMVDGLGLDIEQRAELDIAINNLVPMGRWGGVEEMAKAFLFLASKDSSFITGTELFVDGGLSQL